MVAITAKVIILFITKAKEKSESFVFTNINIVLSVFLYKLIN